MRLAHPRSRRCRVSTIRTNRTRAPIEPKSRPEPCQLSVGPSYLPTIGSVPASSKRFCSTAVSGAIAAEAHLDTIEPEYLVFACFAFVFAAVMVFP